MRSKIIRGTWNLDHGQGCTLDLPAFSFVSAFSRVQRSRSSSLKPLMIRCAYDFMRFKYSDATILTRAEFGGTGNRENSCNGSSRGDLDREDRVWEISIRWKKTRNDVEYRESTVYFFYNFDSHFDTFQDFEFSTAFVESANVCTAVINVLKYSSILKVSSIYSAYRFPFHHTSRF